MTKTEIGVDVGFSPFDGLVNPVPPGVFFCEAPAEAALQVGQVAVTQGAARVERILQRDRSADLIIHRGDGTYFQLIFVPVYRGPSAALRN